MKAKYILAEAIMGVGVSIHGMNGDKIPPIGYAEKVGRVESNSKFKTSQ